VYASSDESADRVPIRQCRTTGCLREPADDAATGLPDMAEDASQNSALRLMRTKPATRRRKMGASF
jgi:hypothetical protein